jgi:hypothetical protein
MTQTVGFCSELASLRGSLQWTAWRTRLCLHLGFSSTKPSKRKKWALTTQRWDSSLIVVHHRGQAIQSRSDVGRKSMVLSIAGTASCASGAERRAIEAPAFFAHHQKPI